MIIRKAATDDIELLIQMRMDYFSADNLHMDAADRETVRQQLPSYFESHIKDNTFVAAIAEIDGKPVSTAFLVLIEKPANPFFTTGSTGTLMNVLTYPEYRRQGIASKIIQYLIDEAKTLGVSAIELLATVPGKPLYENLGFQQNPNISMRLKLNSTDI